MSSPKHFLLGEILLKQALITPGQLQQALQLQQKFKSYKPLGQLLVDQGLLPLERLNAVLDAHGNRARLGAVMLRCQMINQEQLDHALSDQKKWRLRLGKVLQHVYGVPEKDVKRALAVQRNIEFVADATTINIDRALARTINEHYARKNGVCLINHLSGDLWILLDDPADFSLINELKLLSPRDIRLMTATSEEIARVLNCVYGDATAARHTNFTIDETYTFPEKGVFEQPVIRPG